MTYEGSNPNTETNVKIQTPNGLMFSVGNNVLLEYATIVSSFISTHQTGQNNNNCKVL